MTRKYIETRRIFPYTDPSYANYHLENNECHFCVKVLLVPCGEIKEAGKGRKREKEREGKTEREREREEREEKEKERERKGV